MALLLSFLLMLRITSPDPDIVAGYILYWRTFDPSELRLGGPWLFSWDLGKTNIVDFPMNPNLYYDFVATCYGDGSESDFSNEIFIIFVRDEPTTAVNR